jgi:hypothetical protein
MRQRAGGFQLVVDLVHAVEIGAGAESKTVCPHAGPHADIVMLTLVDVKMPCGRLPRCAVRAC